MTPQAKQILVELRETFYAQFSAAMNREVVVSKDTSLVFSPALAETASWVDDQQRFNYLSVRAHTAPDSIFPGRPLTLSIAINPVGGVITNTKTVHRKTGLPINSDWSLNLTVLPEEIVDMAHWVASWVHSQDNNSTAIAAPYGLHVTPTEDNRVYQFWTQTAWNNLHLEAEPHATPADRLYRAA